MTAESSSDTINKTKIYHGVFKQQLLPICDDEDVNGVVAVDETHSGILGPLSSVCCCDISEDNSILCAGFNDSSVRLWSINGQKIRPLKKATELAKLDPEADDILDAMLDEDNAASRLTFIGHSGPVYNTSFNMDNRLLLSCSEDSTGGSDKCALLWTLDRQQPLRMLVGHDSDINCVAFHPNSNYVASGSDDKTLRIWDLANGECVRLFNNYTIPTAPKMAPIQTVQFSHDGRFLATGRLTGIRNIYQEEEISSKPSDVSLGDYYTKSTSVLHLSFTRRNLLLGAGNFDQ
uniref:Uncharacterized protein n=1 Tax=Romanomermis culicivorax TaxID=13658 RepID=A0A915K829_ROMCU